MSTHNPWKTLSSRIVYQNSWIRVREDQVIRPDGNPGIYGVVETRIATGVVALDDQRQVYLVGQFRYATDEYSWEIIEGGSEESETALAAAMRELREEAGLVAEEWNQLGDEVHLSNCHSSEVAVFFLRKLRQTESSPDGTEMLQIKKLPFSDALRMVEAGEVKDAMTIIGLIRASQFLKRQEKTDRREHESCTRRRNPISTSTQTGQRSGRHDIPPMNRSQHVQTGLAHLRAADPVMRKLICAVGPFTLRPTRNRFGILVLPRDSLAWPGQTRATLEPRLPRRSGPSLIIMAVKLLKPTRQK